LKVFEQIEKLKKGNCGQQELNILLDQALQTALIFARKKYEGKWDKFTHLQVSIEDLCVDAVTPLFIESNEGEGIGLKKSLAEWETPILKESHAHFFLFKVVTHRIEQEITKKLKEADPFFGKIIASVNYYLEESSYKKLTYFGEVYIVKNEINAITGNLIPTDVFESLPDSLFFDRFDTVLNSLFDFFNKEAKYFPAIPMNLLFKRLKKAFLNSVPGWTGSSEGLDLATELDTDQLLERSLKDLFAKIDSKYFSKGKINLSETEAIKKAFNAIALDIKNGGINSELYDYMNDQMIDLSKEDFYKKYHSTMDYLLRLFKKDILNKLEKYKLE